eukprot:2480129-Rhodomonas_salina.1
MAAESKMFCLIPTIPALELQAMVGGSGLSDTVQCIGSSWSVTAAVNGVALLMGGLSHACMLKLDGWFFCWGENNFGQLGDGTTLNKVGVDNAVQPAGIARWDVIGFSVGDGFTCITKRSDGSIWCTGSNYNAELAAGTQSPVESHVFVRAL